MRAVVPFRAHNVELYLSGESLHLLLERQRFTTRPSPDHEALKYFERWISILVLFEQL
jgi:hypothetical protein